MKERWRGTGVRFEQIGPVTLKGLKGELTLTPPRKREET